MTRATHFIGRMALEVSVRDLDTAHTLRPRVESMTRQLVPRLLTQAFDAMVPPGLHLQLARLDLDLGVLRPDCLEDDLGMALGLALSDALASALHVARQTPSDAGRLRGAPAHALHQFENYLGTGLLPFQRQAEAFDALVLLHALADSQPAELVTMLRRHGRDALLLERLVLQLGEAGLSALLAVVAPADAVTILLLLGDVVTAHRDLRAPLWEAAAEPRLRRSLWITTLEFLLNDAGSTFNRRRFLAVLLRREAARLCIDYRALLRLLASAVRRASSRAPLRSGLPGALMGLLQEPENSGAKTGARVPGRGRAPGPPTPKDLPAGAHAGAGADADPDAGFHFDSSARFGSDVGTGDGAGMADNHAEPHLRQQIAHYLLTGLPWDGGSDMPARAARNPQALAAEARHLVRTDPAAAPALAERLLRCWLPQELLQALAPALPATLATAGGEGEFEVWQPIVIALLLGQTPALPPVSLPAGARLDRFARLARWLDGGSKTSSRPVAAPLDLKASDPQGPQEGVDAPAVLPDDLLQLGLAELAELFLAADAEQTAARIGLAARSLAAASRHRLLTRLAPWATSPTGPLAATLAELDEADQMGLLVRACAAALASNGIDLAALIASAKPQAPRRTVPATTETGPPRTLRPTAGASQLQATLQLADPMSPTASPRLPSVLASGEDCARALAWLEGLPVGNAEAERLSRCLAAMADAGNPDLLRYLARARNQPKARARWAAVLPPEVLGRLVHHLVPASARTLLDGMRLLNTAWRQTAGFGAPRPDPTVLWASLFDLIAAPEPVNVPAVLAALAQRLARADAARLQVVRARALQLAEAGGHVSVAAALRRTVSQPGLVSVPVQVPTSERALAPVAESARPTSSSPTSPGPASSASPPGRPIRQKPAAPSQTPATPPRAEPQGALYVRNAGLVLLAPLLPTLFERLGLLKPDEAGVPRIAGVEAASLGAHLLQYLVDGRLDRPEPELTLNKLLCGLPTAQPIARSIAPSSSDLEHCDSLLAGVLGHWPAMKSGSSDDLRRTFLQREGRLLRGQAKWTLQVQRLTLDVLTDQLPWSFALVYHRWMIDPIHVTW